jgi:putative alpha-1,2-mannosidase
MQGLFRLMGGNEAAARKLDQQFQIADQHNFITLHHRQDKFVADMRRRAFLNYGNQPSMQVGFVFNYAGKPWMTQYWTREVVERIYSDLNPYRGYNGDEDQGLMGSLAVLLKMGMFQMRAGCAERPVYEIGSPLFDRITIHLNDKYYPGGEFVIETINNSQENRYIQSASLNGQALERSWFYHDELVGGGKLVLEMGAEPNTDWGSDPENLPPSMSEEK